MTAALLDRHRLAQHLSHQRRAMGASSPHSFFEVYLEHHCKVPPSRMHLELFAELQKLTATRGRRLAVAAPRGHAKTTVVSLAYVLWCLLYSKEPFILMLSATRHQAEQLLADIVRELKGNPLLCADFPELCLPLLTPAPGNSPLQHGARSSSGSNSEGGVTSGGGGGGWKVKANHLVLPNDSCVRVLSAGQSLRGMKHRQHRPSLIIGDDLEELEPTRSADQRAKTLEWFQKTLMKAGDGRTNAVVVGTILHYDSLLANLTRERPHRGKAGGWEARVYKAVERFSDRTDLWDQWEAIRFGEQEFEDDSGTETSERFFEANRQVMLAGTKVLWPKREPYEMLMAIRADEGRGSFQSEKQNEPVDPAHCLFREEAIRFWDVRRQPTDAGSGGGGGSSSGGGAQSWTFADEAELLQTLGRPRIYGACDPSLGQRGGRGDYSAIITLAQHKETQTLYVIGADIARRTPDQMIEAIVKLNLRHRYASFAVETNLFRGMFADNLVQRARASGQRLNVKKIENHGNKQSRIEGMEPLVNQGVIRFSTRHQLLLEQLRQFPLSEHDDGPDALEMAVRMGVQPRPLTIVEQY